MNSENPKIETDVLANHNVTKDAKPGIPAAAVTPIYFTAGELMHWKQRVFRLVKCEGDFVVFQIVRPTERAEKLAARRERWLKQHPRSLEGLKWKFAQQSQHSSE